MALQASTTRNVTTSQHTPLLTNNTTEGNGTMIEDEKTYTKGNDGDSIEIEPEELATFNEIFSHANAIFVGKKTDFVPLSTVNEILQQKIDNYPQTMREKTRIAMGFGCVGLIMVIAGIFGFIYITDPGPGPALCIAGTAFGGVLCILAVAICPWKYLCCNGTFDDEELREFWKPYNNKWYRFFEFDRNNMTISYCNYQYTYGYYPNNLHQPTFFNKYKKIICDIQNLQRISVTETEKKSYLEFHYKTDEKTFESWDYKFNTSGGARDAYSLCVHQMELINPGWKNPSSWDLFWKKLKT